MPSLPRIDYDEDDDQRPESGDLTRMSLGGPTAHSGAEDGRYGDPEAVPIVYDDAAFGSVRRAR